MSQSTSVTTLFHWKSYWNIWRGAKEQINTFKRSLPMCYFHISILFPAGMDWIQKHFQFGFVKTGVSPRKSSSTGRILNRTFWLSSPCIKLTSSLSFSHNSRQHSLETLSERATMTSGSIAKLRRSGRDFTDSVEWNLNIFRSLESCFWTRLLGPLRLPQS